MTPSGQPLRIDSLTARRFLIEHQGLSHPFQYVGKTGVLRFLRRVSCVQFDPVNVVGRNPDLVLQARLENYRPALLHDLLYKERRLFDGWDKVSSICLTRDWPHFTRHQQRMLDTYWNEDRPEYACAMELLDLIHAHGHDRAVQQNNGMRVVGNWGFSVRIERAALELLFACRKIHIAERVGSRRIFDATENLLPGDLLQAPDPHDSLEDYHDWHVLRRIGGLGLAQAGSSEFWLGILGMKTPERLASLGRLKERGQILPVAVDALPGRLFYLRRQDLRTLERVQAHPPQTTRAVILPPLDNLLWDRKLLRWIFDFDYVWEIYKKPERRVYGCYTLPVLHGDRFVARFEPLHDRKRNVLVVKNWWWEKDVRSSRELRQAVNQCLGSFLRYLGCEDLELAGDLTQRVPWLRPD